MANNKAHQTGHQTGRGAQDGGENDGSHNVHEGTSWMGRSSVAVPSMGVVGGGRGPVGREDEPHGGSFGGVVDGGGSGPVGDRLGCWTLWRDGFGVGFGGLTLPEGHVPGAIPVHAMAHPGLDSEAGDALTAVRVGEEIQDHHIVRDGSALKVLKFHLNAHNLGRVAHLFGGETSRVQRICKFQLTLVQRHTRLALDLGRTDLHRRGWGEDLVMIGIETAICHGPL